MYDIFINYIYIICFSRSILLKKTITGEEQVKQSWWHTAGLVNLSRPVSFHVFRIWEPSLNPLAVDSIQTRQRHLNWTPFSFYSQTICMAALARPPPRSAEKWTALLPIERCWPINSNNRRHANAMFSIGLCAAFGRNLMLLVYRRTSEFHREAIGQTFISIYSGVFLLRLRQRPNSTFLNMWAHVSILLRLLHTLHCKVVQT